MALTVFRNIHFKPTAHMFSQVHVYDTQEKDIYFTHLGVDKALLTLQCNCTHTNLTN